MMHHLGLDYKAAHELATILEHGALKQDGIDSNKYEEKLKPILHDCETNFSVTPPDLDLKPYADSRDIKTLNKLLSTKKQ